MADESFAGRKVTVIGAGAWGTTLADLIASQGYLVRLWCYEPEVAEQIGKSRENETYLPGYKLNENISPASDIEESLKGSGLVLFVTPTQHFRGIARKCAPFIDDGCYVLSCSKGFEIDSFKRMTEIFAEEWTGRNYSAGVLSGPNLSREIVQRKPAVTLIASDNVDLVKLFQELMSCPHFRVYGGRDVIGTELGGALKNVIAIASGVTYGLGFGHNTLASLITRGLKEMVRLGVSLGAKAETFYGASGLGDLICTAFSELSRNHQVGRRIAGGESLDEIFESMTHVAEGVYTTRAVKKHNEISDIEMPIADEVYRVLFEGLDPMEGVQNLMGRSLKAE
jgi:glycerol-3-phosphate dehydrogenase (NAD(P)+)